MPQLMRVGECVVDVPLREVTAPGARRPRRLTPKAMAVLQVLVEQAGRVVSRDTLLARVWPDTLPTDDVLTQAVTQLRKAFGERRGDTRYIETIAKTGYRLLAPVQAVAPATVLQAPAVGAATAPGGPPGDGPVPQAAVASPTAPASTTALRRGWRTPVAALAVLITVAGLAAGLWLRSAGNGTGDAGSGTPQVAQAAWAAVSATGERPYRMITSAPGFEISPTLSPDAAMVAYSATVPGRRGTVILVQTTDQAQPRQLSFPDDAVSDRVPAWSPDGREIAWLRVGPGEACAVLVAAVNGGEQRQVGTCRQDDMLSFDWTPDGRGLVFGSMSTRDGLTGLRVLDLSSGQWRAIAYPVSHNDQDHAPRYSPDGRWIAFVRNPQLGDVWRVPAAGGTPERLTMLNAEIRGLDWLPDGRSLVFGRRIDSETRLYRLDLEGRQLFDLGVRDAQTPVVASNAPMMAFVRRQPRFGIFRFERSGPSGSDADALPAGTHLFASTGRDTQPSIAPDGRQLVFTSNRSGDFALWWADLERPESLRMIGGLHPTTGNLPQWSPAGDRFVIHGRTSRDGKGGLFEVMPDSGQIAPLPVPGPLPLQAVYPPDAGAMLVVEHDGADEMRLVLYDRSVRPWREQAALQDVATVRVDVANGRVLFTRVSANGLWEADLALSPGSVRRVDPRAPVRWRYQTWAVDEAGVVEYVEQLPNCRTSLRRIGGLAAPVREAASRCIDADRLSSTTGFSMSAAQQALYLSLTTDDGTDIAFMALPAERPGAR